MFAFLIVFSLLHVSIDRSQKHKLSWCTFDVCHDIRRCSPLQSLGVSVGSQKAVNSRWTAPPFSPLQLFLRASQLISQDVPPDCCKRALSREVVAMVLVKSCHPVPRCCYCSHLTHRCVSFLLHAAPPASAFPTTTTTMLRCGCAVHPTE